MNGKPDSAKVSSGNIGKPQTSTPATVSSRMRAVHQSDTAPELAVRRIVHSLGVGYRVCCQTLPGRPDLSNKKNKWCIFVNGCFWHGHACRWGHLPTINLHFWQPQIEQNRRRDETVRIELRTRGFRVLTVWQCELRCGDMVRARLIKFFEATEE